MTEERKERDRHLLIAADESKSAERAVRYVADFLGGLQGFRVTILHVIAVPQEDMFDSETERADWAREHEERAEAFMARYRSILTESGFPEKKVRTRILRTEQGPVPELILAEHRELGSCTIVLGRRGQGRREEFLFGSVSSRIVHEARGCSVWIIE